jgi:hypothetical protein
LTTQCRFMIEPTPADRYDAGCVTAACRQRSTALVSPPRAPEVGLLCGSPAQRLRPSRRVQPDLLTALRGAAARADAAEYQAIE